MGRVSAALPVAQLGKVSTFYEVTVAINSAGSAGRKNACKPKISVERPSLKQIPLSLQFDCVCLQLRWASDSGVIRGLWQQTAVSGNLSPGSAITFVPSATWCLCGWQLWGFEKWFVWCLLQIRNTVNLFEWLLFSILSMQNISITLQNISSFFKWCLTQQGLQRWKQSQNKHALWNVWFILNI